MGFFKNTKKNEINNAGMQRIGVAGSAHHSGATLTAILIATSLKSLGYKVALLEDNPSGHFATIAEDYECRIFQDFFNFMGIDYYLYRRPLLMPVIAQRNYDFLIIDAGTYDQCDQNLFFSNSINVITCGSLPWETNEFSNFFSSIDEECKSTLNYAFLFCEENKKLQASLINVMDVDKKHIYFPTFCKNIFKDTDINFIKSLIPGIIVNDEEVQKPKNISIFGSKKQHATEINENDSVIADLNINTIPENNVVETSNEEDDDQNYENHFPENKTVENNSDQNQTTEIVLTDEQTMLAEEKIEDPVFTSDCINETDTSIANIEEQHEPPEIVFVKGGEHLSFELLEAAKDNIKYVMKHADELTGSAQLSLYLIAYANKEIAGAFGCILRCGTPHTRENGRDGSAVIRIKKEDFEYELKESILKEFLEADSEYLIFPEKDNYISL